MVFKTILSKIKETFNSGSDNIFKTIFKPLQTQFPRLFDDAVAFCAGGEPAAVLLQARQTAISNAREAFGPLATTQAYWYPTKGTDSALARPTAYARLNAGSLAPEAIVRMGKVFAELLHTEIRKHTHDGFPDWLHAILSDWLFWSGKDARGSGVPAPTLETLIRLCRADDLPDYAWLSYYLDRREVPSYWGFDRYLAHLRRLPAIADFFSTHREAIVTDLVPHLATAGRAQLLIEIGEMKLSALFTDFIMDQSVAASKLVRTQAARLVGLLPAVEVQRRLAFFLAQGNADERKRAAEVIGRTLGESGRALLQAAIEKESSKAVRSAIEVALGTAAVQAESTEEAGLKVPSYEAPDLKARVSEQVIAHIQANISRLQEKFKEMAEEHGWQKQQKAEILALSSAHAVSVVAIMNGEATLDKGWHAIARFMNESTLFDDPSIALINVLRLHTSPADRPHRYQRSLNTGPLGTWMKRQPGKLKDLRALADALAHLGWPDDTLLREILYPGWQSSFLARDLPPDGVWPYFALHLEPIVSALMGQGSGPEQSDEASLDRVMEILGCFPELPAATRAPLLQMALAEAKTYRARAQALLERVPGIAHKVCAALKSNSQNARANAARWLARLGKKSVIGELKAALANESREAVRATLLGALEALGEDISELLNADTLHKEALKGLKKAMPKGLAWFPFDTLPALAWSEGDRVDPVVPRWWIVLACKLNDPGENVLMVKYLRRLDGASRQALGLFVLRAFIAQDTLGVSQAEAEKKAQQGAAARFQQWQHWIKQGWGQSFAGKTLEDAHAAIRQEVLGTYLGSAIKEKGIVTLCAFAPGSEAVAMLRAYMKDHYTRRHQIEAMLRGVASGDDPHVIQFLLAVARRYRTRSVQQVAADLVQAVAERNGWSAEQLADRTMPTAGFENDGTQLLDYGARRFTLLLDDQLKIVLHNEHGKPIKSLPAARQDDTADLVKEAKGRFSSARKELQQVVQLTTGRLYEAMCAARRWPVEEWRRYLFNHPVAMRLIQRLIWRYESSGQGFCFRPSEDGTLLDADDGEHSLEARGAVSLVHRSLMRDDEADAWRRHLKDYAVTPLFEQIERPATLPASDLAKRALNTFTGYLSDTFTLRGTLTKLGYQRGTPEDGGFFYYYFKDFVSLGLRAVIFFSGNCVPEENVPAALEHMAFCTIKDHGWFSDDALRPLNAVPPILLSEVMADYQSAADKTGGYDPDWKKKMPW
jgi:hypothetical protein